ncbi:MAG: LysM peptidoglycan-binding domain-containing protein, partial [Verrucomicrobiota bacterium]
LFRSAEGATIPGAGSRAGGAGFIPPAIPGQGSPTSTNPTPPPNPLVGATCVGYAVRQGDTVESIAGALFTDPNTIRAANGITNVTPGQTILVPIQTAILPCR